MTVTLEITPELARTVNDAAGGKVTDAGALQQTVRDLLAVMQPPLSERSPSEPFKRVAGLNRGDVIWISDDFDDPLPDSFWLGEDD